MVEGPWLWGRVAHSGGNSAQPDKRPCRNSCSRPISDPGKRRYRSWRTPLCPLRGLPPTFGARERRHSCDHRLAGSPLHRGDAGLQGRHARQRDHADDRAWLVAGGYRGAGGVFRQLATHQSALERRRLLTGRRKASPVEIETGEIFPQPIRIVCAGLLAA